MFSLVKTSCKEPYRGESKLKNESLSNCGFELEAIVHWLIPESKRSHK